jgi:hypothetical protein
LGNSIVRPTTTVASAAVKRKLVHTGMEPPRLSPDAKQEPAMLPREPRQAREPRGALTGVPRRRTGKRLAGAPPGT